MRPFLKLYTHDGLFHADDVFATALLSMMAEDIEVTRGSDIDIPENKNDWIIYDIGGGELDHHSPENKEANGCHPGTNIPYAACGLVWKKYHKEILEAEDCPRNYMNSVFQKMDVSLFQGIDAEDNGMNVVSDVADSMPGLTDEQKAELVKYSRTSFTISQVIKDFNPNWNSDMDYYDAFMDAVSFAKDIIINRLDSIISAMDGRDYVLQHINYSADHIMILDEFVPWEGTLYSQRWDPKAADIWYVVYPALRGGWNVQCALEDSHDRTSYRHPLPKAWYGLRYEELQRASGIPTASFCHVSGFLAGCETEEDALMMANTACALKTE